MRCDAWVGMLSGWSCRSPVAHSCSLLNHPNSFYGGMFKLNTKFDVDSLLCLLSHFECAGHTVHMLTQQGPPPPLTSTVKLSLFTHVHSSPLSLAARLHRCQTNHSCYINSGWAFSRKTLYIQIKWRYIVHLKTYNPAILLISIYQRNESVCPCKYLYTNVHSNTSKK